MYKRNDSLYTDFIHNGKGCNKPLGKISKKKDKRVPVNSEIRPILKRLLKETGERGYLYENSGTGKHVLACATARDADKSFEQKGWRVGNVGT